MIQIFIFSLQFHLHGNPKGSGTKETFRVFKCYSAFVYKAVIADGLKPFTIIQTAKTIS